VPKTCDVHHSENMEILVTNLDLDLVNYVLDPSNPSWEILHSPKLRSKFLSQFPDSERIEIFS
jgi:hypothetical protein